MKTSGLAVILAMASWPGFVAAADETPPAPTPVPNSALSASTVNTASHDCGCAAGRCRKPCWQKCKDWLCYRPCHCTCCGEYHRYSPPQPALYEYFLWPPCKEGCGSGCCNGGCNGLGERCGFCASGSRMNGLQTGQSI